MFCITSCVECTYTSNDTASQIALFFLIFKFLSDSDLNSVDDSAKILGLAGWRFCSRSVLLSASKASFFFVTITLQFGLTGRYMYSFGI